MKKELAKVNKKKCTVGLAVAGIGLVVTGIVAVIRKKIKDRDEFWPDGCECPGCCFCDDDDDASYDNSCDD